MGKSEKNNSKFRITKQHIQGALAMLLVFVISVSALAVMPGTDLFGTVFSGYEDAEELSMGIGPEVVEAVKDYAGELFTLTGLPVDELNRIKPEHVVVGGYFEGLTVENVEVQDDALLVTVVKGEPVESNEEVDWESYSEDIGIIAVSPKAFTDTSYYYQGYVGVQRPLLLSTIEAIPKDYNNNISQPITLALENDVLSGNLQVSDIDVSGIDSYSLADFKVSGNDISFTLNGKMESFGKVYFTIPGDLLTKGLDVQAAIKVGRVPMPLQNSPLYTGMDELQTLEIFLDFDTFTEDVSLSMLTFGGVMSEFEIIGFERVDYKNIKLELSGNIAEPATGTVRFDSAAVESNKSGRICEVTVETVEEDDDLDISTSTKNLSAKHTDSDKYIISTLVNSKTRSDMQVENLSVGSFVFGIGKEIAMTITKTAAKEGVKAYIKAMADYYGLPKPKEEKDYLKEVLDKLNSIEDQITANQNEIRKRFDKLDYEVAAETIGVYFDELYGLYEELDSKSRTLSQAALDEWYGNKMTYPIKTNNGYEFFSTLKIIMKRLDPGQSDATQRDSLVVLFESRCKSSLPFEHNVYTAVKGYVEEWDACIAQLLGFAAEALDYNQTVLPASTYEIMESTVAELCDYYSVVCDNISDYVSRQSYCDSYNRLIYPATSNIYYLVANDNGASYMIMDTYNIDKNICGDQPSTTTRNGKSITYDKDRLIDSSVYLNNSPPDDEYSLYLPSGKYDPGYYRTIGDPEVFRKTLKAFTDKKVVTLDDLLTKYLVTADNKQLWPFEPGLKVTYLYHSWYYGGLFGLTSDFDHRLEAYYVLSDSFRKDNQKGSSKEVFELNAKKGFASDKNFAILLVEHGPYKKY